MTKELFQTSRPNTYGTMMHLMQQGHQMMEKDKSIKDYIVQVDWKKDCVKLYVCREEK